MQTIAEIRRQVHLSHPLIHCITNPISIHQCANAVLAVGGRPIMAEHPKEVGEITQTAAALMLNLGNITDARMESMGIAARTAKEKGIPILLDAVGIACSTLRREYVHSLLSKTMPTVIKGNYSEIHALYQQSYHASGVDAEDGLDVETLDREAVALARANHTILLATGKTDILTDGTRLVHMENGTPQLSTITGTGCMLGALGGVYLSAKGDLDAMVTACAVLGIAGELSQTDRGSGSFSLRLMDSLSTLTDSQITQYLRMEETHLETL